MRLAQAETRERKAGPTMDRGGIVSAVAAHPVHVVDECSVASYRALRRYGCTVAKRL